MMVKIHRIDEYEINEDDKFFFDANIWMYMYCSLGNYNARLVKDYSDFYQKIKSIGCPILINPMLVSEFVNAYSKMEFNFIKRRDGLQNYKKDFRTNPEYKQVFDRINLITHKKILNGSLKIQDQFHEFNEERFFSNPNTYDFNDEYYCYMASEMNFKIVTHDKDFQQTNYNIEILTR